MNPATPHFVTVSVIAAALQAALGNVTLATNLVPAGLTYQLVDEDVYILEGLTVGKQYRYTPGPNDNANFTNGSTDLVGPCNFIATDPNVYLTGADGKPVTAVVSEVAFQRIELFDVEDLVEAFKTLLISEQRIAIILPHEESWQVEPQQRKLRAKRTVPVTLLISDRVIGNRRDALFGTADNPGAWPLEAQVLPAVTGQLLPNPNGVISRPRHASVFTVKAADKPSLPGRAAVALELDCQGGWMETDLDTGPTW